MANWKESSTESLLCARLYCITSPLDAHLPDWFTDQPIMTIESPACNRGERPAAIHVSTEFLDSCSCPRCNSSFTSRPRSNAFSSFYSLNIQALDLHLVLHESQVNTKRAAMLRKRTERKSRKTKITL